MNKLPLLFLTLSFTCAAATVRPVINDAVLENPDMGLVFYHYANRLWAYGSRLAPGDTLESLPGTTVVYLRLLWSDLEPEEGQFRWDILDYVAQNWIAKGKKIAFRVICSNQTANATPEWVRKAGAKYTEFLYRRSGVTAFTAGEMRWEPVFDDPVFLAKLENFIRAFAARYDGDPTVAFVDIGSFGMYGEGHTGYTVKLKQDETDRMSRIHMDLWKRLMPRTYLVISDDISGAANPAPDAKMMKYARENGIGYRDDSIFCCGPKTPWRHDGWARLFAPTLPVVVETGHYCGRTDPEWRYGMLVDCAEAYRASYFSIHGFPEEVVAHNFEDYRILARRVGYRFEPREISYPETVAFNTPVEISSTWVNSGTAQRTVPTALTWSLTDGLGAIVWSWTDPSFDFRSLEPTIGGKEHPVKVRSVCRFGYSAPIPAANDHLLLLARKRGFAQETESVLLKPGSYMLCLSVGTRAGTPQIALPISGPSNSRRYPIGWLTVQPPTTNH
ncbi:MAG: beta-galactosidase [Kiritimatiellae bacterium]|nr:beta-galactosidase [Kiritimatiellia bacterium]